MIVLIPRLDLLLLLFQLPPSLFGWFLVVADSEVCRSLHGSETCKPQDNIANIVREPILLARLEQENHLSDCRVKRVIVGKKVIEIRWYEMRMVGPH